MTTRNKRIDTKPADITKSPRKIRHESYSQNILNDDVIDSTGNEMCENVMNLTENQLRVLPFLVTNPNITKACSEADIAPKTVYLWLHESKPFRYVLRAHRTAVSDAAFDGIKARVEQAVDALASLLGATSESVRRSAARDILDLSLRLKEQQEFEDRLERLEIMQEVQNEK